MRQCVGVYPCLHKSECDLCLFVSLRELAREGVSTRGCVFAPG